MGTTRTAKMIRKITRRAGVIILGLVVTACSPSSEEITPNVQIVLSDKQGVFLADWRGRNLQPKLLTDFDGTVLIQEGWTSAVDDMIGVVGSPSGTHKVTVYLINPSTGKYQKVFDEWPVGAIAIAPNKKSIAFISTDSRVYVYDLTEHRAGPVGDSEALLTVSWMPDGEHLTYDTRDGWIESVNLTTQRIERLVRG